LKPKRTRLLSLLKTRNNTIAGIKLHFLLYSFFVLLSVSVCAQPAKSLVEFTSEDSLVITADEYINADTLPYIVLLHDQGSSRGEFSDIIERFSKMNYNCLVPDLRNGGNASYVSNETVRRCRNNGYARTLDFVRADIRAAVSYAHLKSGSPVILIGAGANGSLALLDAVSDTLVKAVIALSPREYFRPGINIEDEISELSQPVLITSTHLEYPYVLQMTSQVDEKYKTIFAPSEKAGERGTRALLPDNDSNGEYWLTLLLFFKDLQ